MRFIKTNIALLVGTISIFAITFFQVYKQEQYKEWVSYINPNTVAASEDSNYLDPSMSDSQNNPIPTVLVSLTPNNNIEVSIQPTKVEKPIPTPSPTPTKKQSKHKSSRSTKSS